MNDQEQNAAIEDLKSRVSELEEKRSDLIQKLQQLEEVVTALKRQTGNLSGGAWK